MKITKIVILTRLGYTDHISMETDLPNPLWPFTGNLFIRFETGFNSGVSYVEEHFPGIEYEAINVSSG